MLSVVPNPVKRRNILKIAQTHVTDVAYAKSPRIIAEQVKLSSTFILNCVYSKEMFRVCV